jgi:hypothetical protein
MAVSVGSRLSARPRRLNWAFGGGRWRRCPGLGAPRCRWSSEDSGRRSAPRNSFRPAWGQRRGGCGRAWGGASRQGASGALVPKQDHRGTNPPPPNAFFSRALRRASDLRASWQSGHGGRLSGAAPAAELGVRRRSRSREGLGNASPAKNCVACVRLAVGLRSLSRGLRSIPREGQRRAHPNGVEDEPSRTAGDVDVGPPSGGVPTWTAYLRTKPFLSRGRPLAVRNLGLGIRPRSLETGGRTALVRR